MLALGIAAATAYTARSAASGAWLVLAAAGLIWMGAAARSGRRQATGWLRFGGACGTGSRWRWSMNESDEGAALESVEAALDLQSRMLLRLQGPASVPAWVWVERARAPADWLALRRAIVADRPV